VIRIFGDITKDDIENETRAISALCNGKCRYVVEVLQHGWLVDMSLYFIDMEYCNATLEDIIKAFHTDDNAQVVSGNPNKSLESESTFRPKTIRNPTNLVAHEEVSSFLNATGNRGLTGSLESQY
jgi:hypothetical protein